MRRTISVYRLPTLVSGLTLAAAATQTPAALLTNGDFNTDSGGLPAGWSRWTSGGGWANYQNTPDTDSWDRDGTAYVNVGSLWNGSGGWYQTLPASPGQTYTLSVYSGTEDWDNAGAYMRLLFLDSSGVTVPGGVNNLDTAVFDKRPWTFYTIADRIAPAGTAQVKVEFAAWGGGTTMFDDANLTLVPEPAAVSMIIASIALTGLRCRRA